MIEPLSPTESPVIGRYRVCGVLGSGGMGRVVLATGPDGRFVAIKQIRAHLLDNREFRARFEREVAISARVSGAFTAAVVDFDITGESPWLASVFIPGVPLDKAVRELGPLPVPALRTLASGLASALHSIHSAGLVHRDLKPANVILAADGPRVIDFGIAQATGTGAALTEVGAVVGSPAYMSPEQAMSEPVTSAGDVFSLGSMLCMAATGKSPFAASSTAYALFNIVHSEPQLENVPGELRELIAGCLRKDPKSRPTPAQIVDYLGALPVRAEPWPAPVHAQIAEQTANLLALTSDPEVTQIIPANTPVVAPPDPPARRRRPILLGVGVVATALIVAVAAAIVLRSGDEITSAQTPTPVGAPTKSIPPLPDLRGVDTCAWVTRALGATLPDTAAAKAATTVADWRWLPTASWGCDGSSGGARLAVEMGAALDGFGTTIRVANGYGVARRAEDCAFGVEGGAEGQRWGIVVDTFTRTDCALADHAVDRLTAALDTLPADPIAGGSLSSVDPCALLHDPSLGRAVAKSAHTCEWPGETTVRISLSQPRQRVVGEKTVDLGDGVVVEEGGVGMIGQTECRRVYLFRKLGETYREDMEVLVSNAEESADELCVVADPLVKRAVARLPAR
ncbi:serine/threonine-protein kinase [Nocardia caishijiensis]|uniref:Serine/threonine protein kinase n=1 Tax=Nocardia caishijiensis TaxID=184756 RepID=A0ABQ6YUY9_9NOCA|nr:serine/threonine-protein kinase [Nocardia caishijiensis]KAF0849627.1 serine/threonine protein kinase [Nocardia caishijiensis]